jgi:hypothetical protein
MKRSSETITQVALVLVLGLAAVLVTFLALSTKDPAAQFKPSVLVTYSPTGTGSASETPGLVPFVSRTPIIRLPGFATLTPLPSAFPQSVTPQVTLLSTLEMTAMHDFLLTARSSTQVAMLTEYVQATRYMRIINAEKTRRVNAPCNCSADLLDCNDFQTRAKAQICFNYCKRQGVGDIHFLDDNYDGIACGNKD